MGRKIRSCESWKELLSPTTSIGRKINCKSWKQWECPDKKDQVNIVTCCVRQARGCAKFKCEYNVNRKNFKPFSEGELLMSDMVKDVVSTKIDAAVSSKAAGKVIKMIGKDYVIACVDCGAERIIHKSDLHLVTRCKDCQKKHRRAKK